MNAEQYLKAVLDSQTLANDSEELKALRACRKEVEGHLRDAFGSSPTIRYGGSQAKGTLNKDTYDLDIICYFPSDEEDAGDTLKEIYDNVAAELEKHYFVERKTSALRLRSRDKLDDFHVDVVPGRFIDETEGDSFLFRAIGEKQRLKTNIDVHIAHVKDSGVTDEIRLGKLWVVRYAVPLKTFIIELIVIDALDGSSASLDEQFTTVLTKLRDEPEKIKVEDPANPTGNDLSEGWNDAVRASASAAAAAALKVVETSGWEGVFGALPDDANDNSSRASIEDFRGAAQAVGTGTRPWAER
jgi:hypothetical protein